MSEQQIPHANFGMKPKPSTMGRFKTYFNGMVAGGSLVAIALGIATVILPEGLRPGDIAGKIAAQTLTAEANGSVEATTNKIRREADAAAQAQAKAQIDVAMVTATINERTQALAPLDTLATVADAACIGSKRFAQTAGRDWQWFLGAVADVTCGVGEQVRPVIVASQLEAGTTAAAARGMPLRDASVAMHPTPHPVPATQPAGFPQLRAVPAPANPPQAGRATITPVQAVSPKAKPTVMDIMQAITVRQASQHYSRDQFELAQKIATMLPAEIQAHLRDGLSPGDDDVFVERVVRLMKIAQAMQD